MTLLKIGDTAPAFQLPNHKGEIVSLADLLGQYVVIYFYPRALTPGCTVQACSLRDNLEALTSRGIRVVGVSPDAPSLLHKFQSKEQLNYTLLGDEDHHMLLKYGVWQEKSMYGKKYFGASRVTYILNPKGKIVHVIPKVDPKSHISEVLDWFDRQK